MTASQIAAFLDAHPPNGKLYKVFFANAGFRAGIFVLEPYDEQLKSRNVWRFIPKDATATKEQLLPKSKTELLNGNLITKITIG